jgi:hypothetical protein
MCTEFSEGNWFESGHLEDSNGDGSCPVAGGGDVSKSG